MDLVFVILLLTFHLYT